MTAPYQHEPWEGDPAEAALTQWITAWRTNHPEPEPRPSTRFSLHLGQEALKFQAEGVGRADLVRMFAAVGYDGVCICGASPEEMPGRAPMLETSPRRRRPRRAGAA